MNKSGKAKELGLGGSILATIVGIVFIAQSGSDTTGIILPLGGVFLFVGIIGLISFGISLFK